MRKVAEAESSRGGVCRPRIRRNQKTAAEAVKKTKINLFESPLHINLGPTLNLLVFCRILYVAFRPLCRRGSCVKLLSVDCEWSSPICVLLASKSSWDKTDEVISCSNVTTRSKDHKAWTSDDTQGEKSENDSNPGDLNTSERELL